MLFDFASAAADAGLSSGRPLIVDSFAGGGGASTGIEMALGRSPDIAINHSADALAMHEVNHPETLHLSKNIWQVDPIDIIGNRRVDLAWFSPDCKHFSKAKGGKPVKRNIRDLAWIVVHWARLVRPEVIILENVEEFKDWGPVTLAGKPCPERKGATFDEWTGRLRRLGYKLQFRELRACDYGAPTIRKRFFMIARRDGRPIVWPKPTHGKPDDPDVIAGRKLPWRTAAEIIDWSLPCPSIFETSTEIMAKHGVRAVRPLADATMKRIARGVVRYVIEAKKPFIVRTDMHEGAARNGVNCVDEPLRTQTTAGSHAVVAPVLVETAHGEVSPKGVKRWGSGVKPTNEPVGTGTIGGNHALAAVTMVQTGYGEREGQAARALEIGKPIGTQVAGASKHGVVAAFLAQHNNDTKPNGTDFPRAGRPADAPLGTLTTSPQQSVIAAFLAQHNTGNPGHDAREPLSTVTAGGQGGVSQQAVVAAHMMRQFRTSVGHGLEEPSHTDTATVNKSALISAFLTKYYGEGLPNQGADEPVHTVTTKPRHGVVTVEIDGATYAIADIGMRMLTPRERFRAQGFPDDYIIDRRADGTPITQTVQGSCCGNSVCPPLAKALVEANCAHLAEERIAAE